MRHCLKTPSMSSKAAAGRARCVSARRALPNAGKRNAEASMQHAWSSANFTKLCQFISCFLGFLFRITVCIKQQDEGVACRQQFAPKRNASAALLTTSCRQWLVTTPVVRALQPPLTRDTSTTPVISRASADLLTVTRSRTIRSDRRDIRFEQVLWSQHTDTERNASHTFSTSQKCAWLKCDQSH